MNVLDRKKRQHLCDLYHRSNERASFFSRLIRSETLRLLRFLIPAKKSILDIGCGNGRVLAGLNPSRGVGLDWSAAAIETATRKNPHLEFATADVETEMPIKDVSFDVVLLCNVIGDLLDVWEVLRRIRSHCRPDTRLVITYYNFLWEPMISLCTLLGMRRSTLDKSWFTLTDIEGLLQLNGFEVVSSGSRVLCPIYIPLLSTFLNRFIAHLPFIRRLNIVTYTVARLIEPAEGIAPSEQKTVSVIIPTRNEKGNIKGAVQRTPQMGRHTELIFVDGDSTDGTVEEIQKSQKEHAGKLDIRLIHQIPPETGRKDGKMLTLGKGDAVRKGFAAAKGDILIILDSDLTVPPEDLNKFFLAIAEGRAEFINGNRLSYPLEKQAMRFLNLVANWGFALLFSWLLGQRVKDTLCGTKVLSRINYQRIAEHRDYFGDFDPFGDFDLLFGAAKLNLKIMDLPVRYRARVYGDIKIERFRHGWLLLKMCVFAFRRFKL